MWPYLLLVFFNGTVLTYLSQQLKIDLKILAIKTTFEPFWKFGFDLFQDRYISDDVERQWKQHNVDDKDTIGWEEYRQLIYGFLDDPEGTPPGDDGDDDDSFSYKYVGV